MNAVISPEAEKPQEYRHLMKGPDKPKWTREMVNDIRRTFQGIRYIKVTYTCSLIHKHEVPQDRKVAYIRIVCDIRPQKKETNRVQLTVGGENFPTMSQYTPPQNI